MDSWFLIYAILVCETHAVDYFTKVVRLIQVGVWTFIDYNKQRLHCLCQGRTGSTNVGLLFILQHRVRRAKQVLGKVGSRLPSGCS